MHNCSIRDGMDLDAAIAVLMAQIIDQMLAQAYPADLAPSLRK
jgi:hypothetical protein